VELALQKFAVDWVKDSVERYDIEPSDDSVRITSITVSELEG
jgi:hypothetical protein